MKLLLVQEDLEIREKLSFSIEATFPDLALIRAATLDEAKKALAAPDAAIVLIIFDLPSVKPALIEELMSHHQNIGVLWVLRQVVGKPQALTAPQPKGGWSLLGSLQSDNLISDAIAEIRKLSDNGRIPKLTSTADAQTGYCKIKTEILLSVAPLKGDVYILLGENHYVKLFHEGDSFDPEDLEKYTQKKGIQYLYIPLPQTKEFIQKYQQDLLAHSGQMTLEDLAEKNESFLETVQALNQAIGFTKEVQGLVKTQLKTSVDVMGKSPNLSQVLAQLEAYRGKYISSHSTLTAYFACAIATHLEWGSETTFHKLTLASMLHDIALDNHDLAAVESMGEIEKGNFTKEEKKLYASHMMKAAEMARKMSDVPSDVDAIIAQHHERPDGKGFPRGLTASYISPLSSVFIVAHELGKRALKVPPGQLDIKAFMEETRTRFNTTQFKKIIGALEELTKL